MVKKVNFMLSVFCRNKTFALTVIVGFPGGSGDENVPAMWETWVQALGREDPLEKGMPAHSSIPAWRTP